MYETISIGTCLVTDVKDNLRELLKVRKAIIACTSAEDCVEKVCYLLEHEDEQAAIARAGQQRTLKEHTYFHRMQELVDIIERYWK